MNLILNYSEQLQTVTNADQTLGSRYQQADWIAAEICNVIAIFYVLWFGLNLIVYGKHTGKWRRINRSNTSKVNAGAVYTSAVCATFCSFLRLLPNQAVFNLGHSGESPSTCEIAVDLSVAGYVLTLVSVYIFFWLRQRSLYQHPAMRGFSKRWLLWLNCACIVFIIGTALLLGAAVIVPKGYVPSGNGCIWRYQSFAVWPYYLTSAAQLLAQCLLLFLLTYPLCLRITENSSDRIIRIIKRSTAFAVVSVFSDVIATIVVIFIIPQTSLRHISLIIYDINMLINVSGILFSFESWKSILTSLCKTCAVQPDINRPSLTSSEGRKTTTR